MAQKRMFDKMITNSDDFLELPDSSQVLYFHLSMNADDDGFVNNWKSILKMTSTKEDDMKILMAKKFIIPFDSGVIVIRHWRINNYLRNDRYKETNYKKEKELLIAVDGQPYELKKEDLDSIKDFGIPTVYPDKNRIEKNSIDKNNIYSREVDEIIDYLNDKLNSNYKKTTKKTCDLIKARLKEGFTTDDFRKVIDNKYYEWYNTEQQVYLRPETLFGTKFESYLNQKTFIKKKTLKDISLKEIEEEQQKCQKLIS